METLPWYKRVFRNTVFSGKTIKQGKALEQRTSREYSLSDPQPKAVTIRRRKKRKFGIQPPSNDPRFNHALRRKLRIDVDTRSI